MGRVQPPNQAIKVYSLGLVSKVRDSHGCFFNALLPEITYYWVMSTIWTAVMMASAQSLGRCISGVPSSGNRAWNWQPGPWSRAKVVGELREFPEQIIGPGNSGELAEDGGCRCHSETVCVFPTKPCLGKSSKHTSWSPHPTHCAWGSRIKGSEG